MHAPMTHRNGLERRWFGAAALLVLLQGCWAEDASVAPSPVAETRSNGGRMPASAGSSENDARWHALVASLARHYTEFGRVDDEGRFAPWLCRAPDPGRARRSEAAGESGHGKKIFYVYALDAEAYGAPKSPRVDPQLPEPVTQALIKESFASVQGAADESPARGAPRPALADGVSYHAGEPSGLFLLVRPAEPGARPTDEGWIYATVSPDGTITGAGAMASCMECHTERPERWFGLDDLPKGR